jgi:hypothetical protein
MTSDVDPTDILNSIGEDNLLLLADKVNVKVPLKKKSKGADFDKLVELLVDNVVKEGTLRVLGVIKVPRLKLMVDIPDVHLEEKWQPPERKTTPKKGEKGKEKKKPYPSKTIMTNILEKHIAEKTWESYLGSMKEDTLLKICGDIDDLSDFSDKDKASLTKKEMINAIMTNIYSFGMNHLLSTLNVNELHAICKVMKLDVDSDGHETLVDSIIEKKDFQKVEKKPPKISKSKPSKIESGISKADLNNWFNRDEIEEWLKKKKEGDDALKELKLSGKKSQLIERTLKILDGDIKGAVKKKMKRGRSKSKSREEGSEDKGTKKRKKNETKS